MIDLHVRDLHPRTRLRTDLYGLVYGLEHLPAHVAHVCVIAAAVLRGHARELDHLTGCRKRGRHVHQPGRESERAGTHRLIDGALHGRHFVAARRAIVYAHRCDAYGHVTDELGDVEPERRHAIHVLGERAPLPGQSAVEEADEVGELLHVFHRQRRRREAAVAGDLQRHALARLLRAVRIHGQVEVVVRVHVDEAGTDDAAIGLHDVARPATREIADLDDTPCADCDVGAPLGRTGSVDHPAAGDEVVQAQSGTAKRSRGANVRVALSQRMPRKASRRCSSCALS